MCFYAQQPSTSEYQLKAVFLFNFTHYVTWPPAALPFDNSPMIIGILGDDPFKLYLEQVVKSEKVNDHPLFIRHFHSIDEVDKCHILFIDQKNIQQSELEELQRRNILTVSDQDDFLKYGGIIRFDNDNGKIEMAINLQAARAADLVISSKLLRLMRIYKR
jgi:hypothetical protein